METRILIASALLSICLSGWAQQGSRPTASDDPTLRCLAGLETDQRLQILVPRIGSISRPNKATIDLIASTDKPDENERRALSIWAVARETCIDMGKDFRATYAPRSWVMAFDAGQTALLQAIAALYGGTMTYGEFIVERQRIAIASTSQANRDASQENAARVQQSAENIARLNAAVQLLLSGTPPPSANQVTCLKTREWTSGSNKNCVYSCLGSEAVQTIPVTGLCPISISR